MLATEDDLAFCRAYGHISHDFYGDLGWFHASKEMQEQWAWMRGDCPLEWEEAKRYVREGWDAAERKIDRLPLSLLHFQASLLRSILGMMIIRGAVGLLAFVGAAISIRAE